VTGTLVLLMSLALEVGGCNGGFRPVEWSELAPPAKPKESPFRVISRKGLEVASLGPQDIVRVMQRIGFADEQILDLGTDLHNALRFAGEAKIVYRKETLALFAVKGDYLRIRSRSGEFAYQISQGQFVDIPSSIVR